MKGGNGCSLKGGVSFTKGKSQRRFTRKSGQDAFHREKQGMEGEEKINQIIKIDRFFEITKEQRGGKECCFPNRRKRGVWNKEGRGLI